MKLFKWNTYQSQITVEQIQQVFTFGKLTGITGFGLNYQKRKLLPEVGGQIKLNQTYIKKSKDGISEQIVPQHLQWSHYPCFVYVAVVDEKVKYYFTKIGSPLYSSLEITDSKQIKIIDKIFAVYYQEFGLPDSLTKKNVEKVSKKDKLSFLSAYLKSRDKTFFENNFSNEEDDEIDKIAMWIDWKEDPSEIVGTCERILQTKELSTKMLKGNSENGEIIISYRNKEKIVQYINISTGKDKVFRALNEIMEGDYEIRLCKESVDSDTLCFVPLKILDWEKLEEKYSGNLEQKFVKIKDKIGMFG